ncbi:3-phosphoinositide dependent protein kinase-1, partial [Lecanoromycetidae sp. Uapishka_2]
MDGDLSLAQSLGGLRIANPDDTPISPVSSKDGPSPRREPTVSPLSAANIITSGDPDLQSAPSLPPNGIAGVPNREDDHTDRSYRQSQMYNGNRALPPRKSSRNMDSRQLVSTAGHPSASDSGMPYTMEGGPLKSSEEWQDRGAAVGTRQGIDVNGKPVLRNVKKGVKDFHFGRTLGEGSYSTVMAATDRETGKEYAIKVLDKRHIIKEKKVKYVNIEKDTLNRLTDHPGVVRLYYTFQDEQSLYFVLDLASQGELLGVLKRMTTFDEECTRFYGAEILDTIDYMHARGVIHRDLKPENVLLDDQMHVKITDFGTAKILDLPRRSPKEASGDGNDSGSPLDGANVNKANSFVGTAEYVSPELLKDKQACKASDLWAFGCIIYQLLAGRPPFKAGNEYLTFQKIVALDYQFPKGFPEVAKDLVERLLVLEPASRLSIEHIKNHEFFDGTKWGRGLWRQQVPRLNSYIPSAAEPKKLNGPSSGNGNNYPPNIQPSHSTSATRFEGTNSNVPRPSPRIITELPPPSQLDIEWSPVLTRNNERILKLGNLIVNTSQAAHSPDSKTGVKSDTETPKKFSRFFGGKAPKKTQRLVMVTSSARIIIVASGGEEKKSKVEIPLLISGCSWRKLQDPKGLTYWCVDTNDKHYTFEDPKSASSDGSATSASAQEWLDTIETAREVALSQSVANSYSGDDALKDMQMGPPSSSRGLDLDSPGIIEATPHRHTLQKHHSSDDSFMGRKRFSKRQSKSGLAAVF